VGVRVDLAGEPAAGFVLENVEVVPNRVWLTGARSQVLRLSEVVTEPVDVSGMKESVEREVTLFLPAGNVSMENNEPVKVVVHINPQRDVVPETGEEELPEEQVENS
jgi:YbbR domain-containing protein